MSLFDIWFLVIEWAEIRHIVVVFISNPLYQYLLNVCLKLLSLEFIYKLHKDGQTQNKKLYIFFSDKFSHKLCIVWD